MQDFRGGGLEVALAGWDVGSDGVGAGEGEGVGVREGGSSTSKEYSLLSSGIFRLGILKLLGGLMDRVSGEDEGLVLAESGFFCGEEVAERHLAAESCADTGNAAGSLSALRSLSRM